jgi:hypothetical protein
MEQLEKLVGKRLVENSDVSSLDQSQVVKSTVEKMAKQLGYADVRYCEHNGFSDMEFRPNRVKVTTDNKGIIQQVSQG